MRLLATVLLAGAALCSSLTFDLPANSHKCFIEELPENEQVRGSYSGAAGYSQAIDLKVTNPKGEAVLEAFGKDSNDFNLYTSTHGDYNFCFYNRLTGGVKQHPALKRAVTFKISVGQEAKDYDQVARKEHLKPIEVMLRMMEDAVRDVYATYYYFKQREAELRDTSESANTRALWIAIINTTVFFSFAAWQALHLKKYFVTKKLIN
eukprot:EG_transcript_26871